MSHILRAFPAALVLLLLLAACDRSDPEYNAEVVPYTGATITAADATVTDPSGEKGWQARRMDDRVVLSRSTLCGDECTETIQLSLRTQGDAGLPAFNSLIRIQRSALPERRTQETIAVRRIEIQDWNTDGVVSGRVVGEEGIVFWATLAGRSGQ
ncbi:hypothetical protein [Longibacter sp.]|jgi:hypothetical protein|uniref:hypothetical protein n=1 Tax=Longibacter sp. TaxID=2045415 RepID=UPI003EC13853